MSQKQAVAVMVLLLSGVVLFHWWCNGFPLRGIDDAQIFFTYASSLIHGNGLRYAGAAAPVEGFTSLGWMLVCASQLLVGADEVGVLLVALLLFALTQALACRIICRICDERGSEQKWLYVVFYGILVATAPGYVLWSTITLMDTCLFGFFLLVAAYFCLFPQTAWPKLRLLTFAVLPLVRPEGMLLAPLFALILWSSLRKCACAAATRTLLAILAAVAAATGALLAFRLWTFGYPLPNTYYAKVSPSLLMNIADGVSYLLHFVSSGIVPGLGVWLAIFGAAVMAFCLFASPAEGDGRRPRFSRREGVLSLFGLVALLPSTLTGGDYFPLHRFCQPAYPLLCLLIVFYAQRVPWPAVSRVKIWIMTSIFLIWQTFAGFSPSLFSLAFQGSPIVLEFQIAADSVTRSAILDAFFDEAAEKPVIGVYMAGGISRHYSGMIVDLLGLNNAYIAHQPGDRTGLKGHAAFSKAAFFELKPDLVPIRPDNEFAKSLLKGLFDDESFLARYSFGSLSNLCKGNEVSGFYRLTYLDRVTKNPCFRYNMLFVYDKPHRRWIDLTVSRVESGK